MKNLTRKLLASVFVMIFALVAVATTTYAWFTIGNEVNVDKIDVNVKADSGDLTFRAVDYSGDTATETTKTSDYLKQLSWADIYQSAFGAAQGATDADKLNIDAVTSLDGQTFNKIVDPSGSYDSGHVQPIFAPTSENYMLTSAGYLSFKLEFKSSAPGYLVLTNKTAVTTTAVTKNIEADIDYTGTKAGTDGKIAANSSLTVDPKDALRISFVNTQLTKAVIYNPTSANDHQGAASETVAIAGIGTKETPATTTNLAVQYYKSVWKNNKTVSDNLISALNSDGATINALNYTNNATAFPASTDLVSTNLETYRTSKYIVGFFSAANSTISLTVNVWMEGWDADCFNFILGQNILINLGFGILKADSPSLTGYLA
jgi:hypothetical protein